MAGLDSLFQVAPQSAAFELGINQAQDRQTNALKQQELAQLLQKLKMEMEQTQQKHPLELERQRLLNQTTQAQLPGITAKSGQEVLKLSGDTEMYQDNLDTDKSKNRAARVGNEATIQDKLYKSFKDAAVFTSGTEPYPGAHAAAIHQAVSGLGVPEESPLVQHMMSQISNAGPRGVSGVLNEWAEKVKNSDPKHLGEMQKQKAHDDAAMERQKEQDRSQERIARIRESAATARRAAAKKTDEEIYSNTKTALGKYNLLITMIQKAQEADDADAVVKYTNRLKTVQPDAEAELAAKHRPSAEMVNGKLGTTKPPTLAGSTPTNAAPPVAGGVVRSGNKFTIEKTP